VDGLFPLLVQHLAPKTVLFTGGNHSISANMDPEASDGMQRLLTPRRADPEPVGNLTNGRLSASEYKLLYALRQTHRLSPST
jgi:hypothetical protein